MYAGPWRHVRSLTVGALCVALSVAGHLAGGGSPPDLAHAPVAVLGLAVVTALLCLALGWASRHRWTFGRATLALGLGQAVLHTAFVLLLGPAGHPGGPAAATLAGVSGIPGLAGGPGMAGIPGFAGAPGMAGTLGMADPLGMAGTPGMAGIPGMVGTPGMPGMTAGAHLWSSGSALSMAAGHAVAALAVAAVLARTDAALAMWSTLSTARTHARRAVRRMVQAVDAAARSAEEHAEPLRRPASAGCTWLLQPVPRQRVDGRCLSRRGPPRPA
jgi:hypothetical protein